MNYENEDDDIHVILSTFLYLNQPCEYHNGQSVYLLLSKQWWGLDVYILNKIGIYTLNEKSLYSKWLVYARDRAYSRCSLCRTTWAHRVSVKTDIRLAIDLILYLCHTYFVISCMPMSIDLNVSGHMRCLPSRQWFATITGCHRWRALLSIFDAQMYEN